jgi:hypothetical protein
MSRVLLAICALLIACGRRPAPVNPSERALFRDLERQVTINAATGWGVDRLEISSMLETALDSVCRVEPLARRQLATWLDSEISRLGGPVDVAWRERGRKLRKVGDLLVLTRVKLLLQRADEVANECPFWLEPEPVFRGRQISAGRFQLVFGGGGKGIVQREGNDVDVLAGGAGRLMFGRVFQDGDGAYVGLEIGGSAAFPKDEFGNRSTIELAADFVAPIVYRRTFTNSYAEFEAGWIGRSTERDWGDVNNGVHLGVAFGGRALRARFLFPGVVFGMSWERLFEGEDITMLKVGIRVSLDLDLF